MKDKWEFSPGKRHRKFKLRNIKLASVADEPRAGGKQGWLTQVSEDGGLYGGNWELLKVIYRECHWQIFS